MAKPSNAFAQQSISFVIFECAGAVIRRVYEFRTAQEVELNGNKHELLEIQGLLMSERILGPQHNHFLKRLNQLGNCRADSNGFVTAFPFRMYSFHMEFLKHGILTTDTVTAAQNLVALFISWNRHLHKMEEQGFEYIPFTFEMVMDIFHFLIGQLPDVTRQILTRPFYPKQREPYDM